MRVLGCFDYKRIAVRTFNHIHGQIDIQIFPVQMPEAHYRDIADLANGLVGKPWKIIKGHKMLVLIDQYPKAVW